MRIARLCRAFGALAAIGLAVAAPTSKKSTPPPAKKASAGTAGSTKAKPAESAETHVERAGAPGNPAASAPPRSQSLGAVRPSNLVLPQLAVTGFDSGGFAEVIGRDLVLADVAERAANSSAVAAAIEQDRTSQQVNIDAWTAAGVNYVLRGTVNAQGAQAELYDIASKQRLFGKTYAASAQNRRLAHKIADDVMTGLTNLPGIFSTRICYLSDHAGGTKEVMVMDADGGDARQLTNESALLATPCWGKSGTEIYYTSYRDNNPDLYGITLGGQRFEVSRRPGQNISPAWCESLQRLAVTLSKDGNPEIYTMTREGRNLQRVTNSPDADTAPDWSPDGSRIAFTSDRGGSPQIYTMSASGGEAQPLTNGGYHDSPAWSPDGKKIAYVRREGGEFNVYVADVSGGATAQLTHKQQDNQDPSWGPDSKHLIFTSNRSGNKEVYMISLDTKVAHALTRTSTNCTAPAWSPVTP